MSSKYYRNTEGEPVKCNLSTEVEKKDYIAIKGPGWFRLACCDCGLVHNLAITQKDAKSVNLHFWRDHRRTAQLRRHEYGELHKLHGSWKLVRRKRIRRNL